MLVTRAKGHKNRLVIVRNKMKVAVLVFVFTVGITSVVCSLHASCKIEWTWKVNCTAVNEAIINQMKKWKGPEGCDKGGEKCNYNLTYSSPTLVKGVHTTPVKHYKDDLSFKFTGSAGICNVEGFSTSETWYAVLDSGTNYCNLHNLITGAGLDKQDGYKEDTSDSQCTQYSSRNCGKY